jgi:hypothetical protein
MDTERSDGDYLLMGVIALNGAAIPTRDECPEMDALRIGAAVYHWTDDAAGDNVALEVKGEESHVCVYLCRNKAMALARLIVAAALECGRTT